MKPQLNHTVVGAHDPVESAEFLAELLGFEAPVRLGHFVAVETGNGVSLDFARTDEVHPVHLAFLVTEREFDDAYGKIVARGMDHWADPQQRHPGEINTHDGGRGVYFLDPSGNYLEIITRPYGSGPVA